MPIAFKVSRTVICSDNELIHVPRMTASLGVFLRAGWTLGYLRTTLGVPEEAARVPSTRTKARIKSEAVDQNHMQARKMLPAPRALDRSVHARSLMCLL